MSTADRWRRVESIYHEALARPLAERSAFVAGVCTDDADLQHEVEELLAHSQSDERLLGQSVGALAAQLFKAGEIAESSLVGRRIGPYEVRSVLGAGGMGQVYRARDTQLGRDVAIKVLPPAFVADRDRLARFEREARILASLNHPNIATIHAVEPLDGSRALVMELVDGDTLGDRLAGRARRHGLPLDQALPIAKQIAEALEAAHQQGIVHRDLKPANINVRPDGLVKVLDFGLAKIAPGPPTSLRAGDGGESEAPTLTDTGTREGIILGTAAYMSPEQARGQAVDTRTDIWSFGCVLYELLTGRLAFPGATSSDHIAAILERDPDLTALPAEVPTSVRRLLRRCLEKDARRRLSAIGDARLELDDAATDVSDAAVVSAGRVMARLRRTAPVVLASLLAGALIAGLPTWFFGRPAPAPARVERFVIGTSDAPPLTNSNNNSVWMSSDGARILYRTGLGGPLWTRGRDTFEATSIPGTEGGTEPFFSPDGRWMAFFNQSDSTLKRMPALGGAPQTICKVDSNGRGGSWGLDDQIVFSTANSKGLMRVSSAGGEPQVLTRADTSNGEMGHFWPEILQGGRGVLFTAWTGTPERSRIAVLSTSDGQVSTLVAGGTYPRYAPNGHLLFALAGTLRAVRFDPARLALVGEPAPVLEDLAVGPSGGANYAIGTDGSLAYATGRERPDTRTLVWVDRQGRQDALNVPPQPYVQARVSPDGTKLALDVRDQHGDIWIWDLTKETMQNLTSDPGQDRLPAWTPDSSYVAFMSGRDGRAAGVFRQRADGSGPAERIDAGTRSQVPLSFSPDGKRLITLTSLGGPEDLAVLDLGDPRRHELLFASPFSELNGVLSPDGRWLAYDSNESGTREVYVRPFPDVATSRQLVSPGGGTRPLWSKDGRELFYYLEPGTIMTVPVRLGSTFSFDRPTVVVKGEYLRPPSTGRHYDVSPDGKRFLLMREPTANGRRSQPELRIILHFFDELNRLAGNRN